MATDIKTLQRAQELVAEMAKTRGQTEAEARAHLKRVLDFSWRFKAFGLKAKMAELFPNGKPSVEEFIVGVQDAVLKERKQ